MSKDSIHKILGVFVFLLLPIWIFGIAPYFKKIPEDFVYGAHLFSLDNFYDPLAKKFQGDQISKTIFRYDIASKTPQYYVIRNIFSVSTLSDKNIFSVMRLYYIDPFTGKHVQGPNAKSRLGYLFAPRYVNKQDFYYWHVNYDTPALMHYVNSEYIDGLYVYHYLAKYQADQTNNLMYLTDVPEKFGIITHVNLNLWVEPISGWLVKYQDNSESYYYDIKTKQIEKPWNKFTNRYAPTSINDQIVKARALKFKIILVDFLIPIMIIFVGILLITKKHPHFYEQNLLSKVATVFSRYSLIVFYVLLIAIGVGLLYYLIWQKYEPNYYTIGISTWIDSPEFRDNIKGFKDKLAKAGFVEGKNIKFIERNPNANYQNQINHIQEFIDKKVNLIFTLTTPGTLIAKGMTTTIPIIFSEVVYPEESNLISSLISSKNNLVGTRNYITAAAQFYFLDKIKPHLKKLAFIYQKGDPDSELQFQNYKQLLEDRNIKIEEIAAIDHEDLLNKLNQQSSEAFFLACDAITKYGFRYLISLKFFSERIIKIV